MLKRFSCFLVLYFCIQSMYAQTEAFSEYTVHTLNQFSPVSGSGTKVNLSDDEVSDSLPIGFEFKFFGKSYSSVHISSNGFVTFSPGSSGCCSGQFLPNASDPNNLIAFAWEDLRPNNTTETIEYFTIGEAPRRALVINFDSISHYGGGFQVTSQVVLYETSNIIEIHTTDMPSNGGDHTMGIENEDGTKAFFVNGRNQSNWSATNESVQFIPIYNKNDAGVSFLSPKDYACEGTQNLEADIQNYGNDTIESMDIFWELNGVLQDVKTLNTILYPLTSGDSSRTKIILGSHSFSLNDTYTLKAWTSNPNGIRDSVNTNDTLSVAGAVRIQGAFTIGGSNPDYATFSEAITSLSNGICGPVVFNVRTGIYNEQVRIPQILNAVANNTVTFQSETGNPADVSLTFSATSLNNYTLLLDGADNIHIKNMSIEATNTSYGRVVELRNGASNNHFINNSIKGVSLNSSTDNITAIYSNQGSNTTFNDHTNSFSQNTITGGSYGIRWYGYSSSSGSRESGLVIDSNYFENQYIAAIYLANQDFPVLKGNTIVTASNYSSFYGIYMQYCYGPLKILRNKITILNGYGISQIYCGGSSSSYGILANNFISINGASTAYGIMADNCSYQKIVHNSINVLSSSSSGMALYAAGGSYLRMNNNIFVNNGGGYAVSYYSDNNYISDYNNLYSKGTYLASYNNTNSANIASWQSLTNYDENSFSTNPLFNSSSDLHINKALLNGSGVAVTEVTEDIDGELRGSTPDIGADEFTPTGENAELVSLQIPVAPFPAGTYPIKVAIRNAGASTLTSLDIVWEVNDLPTTYVWSGSLASGLTDTVTLGNYSFTPITSYQINAWVSNPNNTVDIENDNDTIYSDKINVALAGVYTIGGVSPDFTNFSQAAEALNKGGILDAVTFNVRNGTYTEQIILNEFPGTTCSRPVTFKSESGDSTQAILAFASNSSENYTVKLNGAKSIIFKQLTLKSLNSTYGRIVDFASDADCNVFEGNIFEGVVNTSTSTNMSLVHSISGNASTDNSDNNHFINNRFTGGSYGIDFTGYSSSANFRESGNVIRGNSFNNQRYRAIHLYNQNAPEIKENSIVSTSTNSSFIGIYTRYCYDTLRIAKNKITASTGIGINMGYTYGSVGKEGLVSNNFISVAGSSTAEGIYMYQCYDQKIYNNSINITGTHSTSGKAFSSYYYRDIDIKNNIFSNSGGGYAIYLSNGNGIVNSDYNNLYTTGPVLGYWNTNNSIFDLASWKSNSLLDQNSISTKPLYTSETDLHVNKALLHNAGIALPEIVEDIDGEQRDNIPDIGADEFTPSGSNAQLAFLNVPQAPFAQGVYPVSVIIKNSGATDLSSLTINWQVNSSLQTAFDWTGNLSTNQTDTIALGTYAFNSYTSNTISSWVEEPNGETDIDPSDDTLRVFDLYPALSGPYVIGTAPSDFSTINAAVNALSFGGILSPVTFNIKNGLYAEQLSLVNFPGSSCTVPVIFQSLSEDSSLVTIRYNATSAANYTLQVSGAKGLVFKNLTFESTNSVYGRVIDLEKGASCLTFEGNSIKGIATSSTSTNHGLVYSIAGSGVQDNSNNNIFRNNLFENGSSGLYYTGYSSSRELSGTGIVVESNTFKNQYYRAIYLLYQIAPVITGNTISSTSTRVDFYGMNLYCHDSLKVEKNRINLSNGYGIYLNGAYGSVNNSGLIANNFISVGGTSTSVGIYVGEAYHQNIYYNSVNITGTSTSAGRAFFKSYYGNNISLINNIFANAGGGYAIYNDNSNAIDTSDYNDLFTSGTNVGYLNGNISNLAAWKTASSKDQNSISVDPQFVSGSDLHVSNVNLNANGLPIHAVRHDIDGQVRNALTPDIGADEFTTANHDVSILSLSAPVQAFASGTSEVKMLLLNNAILDLTSVIVHWEVNGEIQTPYQWTGLLESGKNREIPVGTFDFEIDSNYTIKGWTSAPNNLTDEDPSNDTLMVDSLYAALAGVYTIGGDNPDFPLFSDAVRALSLGGVVDSVIFNVRTGTYLEQISIPEILGATDSLPVVFKSESGDKTQVKISYSGTSDRNYVIQLRGADYVTFRDMTIEASGTTYSTAVDIRNGSGNNNFLNNEITSPVTNTTTISRATIYSYSGNSEKDNDHNNAFENNLIKGGSHGMVFLGYSSSVSYRENGLVIRNNTFENQSYNGIQISNQESPLVHGNSIRTSSTRTDFFGINAQYCYNNLTIEKNKMVTNGGYGINLYSCSGSAPNKGLISNNFITIGGTGTAYGIYSYYSNHLNIYYNSINVTSSSTSGRSFFNYDGNNLQIINNIFVNSGSGYAVYHQYPGTNTISNNNNIFSTGTNFVYWSANYTNLQDLQLATGKEENSVSVNPLFTSSTDLHVREVSLKNAGIPLSVIDDIDGDIRNASSPDIGADEFLPLAGSDAGIVAVVSPAVPFPAAEHAVTVRLRNYGADTLNSVSIKWQINSATQADFEWTGALASGKEEVVSLGSVSFELSKEYTIKSWTINPNAKTDTLNYNDTTEVDNLYAALQGIYTIGGLNPDFTNFTEAATALTNGGVLDTVVFNVRDGVYTEQISLSPIIGVSALKPVIFQSESGDNSNVTLSYAAQSSGNYTIQLIGADYITFRNMTLAGTGTSYANVIDVRNKSSYNLFKGNIIKNAGTTGALIYSPSNSLDEYNRFEENTFINGSYGIQYYGYNSSNLSEGVFVANNNFSNQRTSAVYMAYANKPEISGNSISTAVINNDYKGIYLTYCSGNYKILKNKVYALGGGTGILIDRSNAIFSLKGLMANNFITVGGTGTASGISIFYSEQHDVVFNTVNIIATNTSSGTALNTNGSNGITLLNNIFANKGNGYLIYTNSAASLNVSDYNNLYTTGSYVGYIQGSQLNFAEWKSTTSKDGHSLAVEPFFFSDTDLHVSQILLDSVGIPFAGITDDVDGESRNLTKPDIGADEFTYLTKDVGVSALVNPVTGCGWDSLQNITVRISNYGGVPQTGFDVAYSINGGDVVIENIQSLAVLPGKKLDYTFTQPVRMDSLGSYTITAFSLLTGDLKSDNDTLDAVSVVNYPVIAASAWNMLPGDNASNMSPPVLLSWSPVADATHYDLYIWSDSTSMPSLPTVSNLTNINYSYNQSLNYGFGYKWQLVAKNSCSQDSSPVHQFSLKYLPDLIVNNIEVPTSAYSGQNIDLSWEVKNIATGNTGSAKWNDEVYLSNDIHLDKSIDLYLGNVSNFSALSGNESYNQTAGFVLPQGISGDYYVFVQADRYNSLNESNEANNLKVSAGTIQINLTPPPDLKVTSIISPENAFSGQQINLTWTVTNTGAGDINASSWYDRIYLTQSKEFTGAGSVLGKFIHTGSLGSGDAYTVSQNLTIPDAVFGTYYIYVQTDYANSVYEHVFEVNNITQSDSINIILTPPTDYVVTAINIPATASNKEKMMVEWTVENQGGSAPTASSWTDEIYISSLNTFDKSSAVLLGAVLISSKLDPFKTYTARREVLIPSGIAGPYFIYVYTDARNQVFEHSQENNNITKSDPIAITAPDLIVGTVSVPLSAASGRPVAVEWFVENSGMGNLVKSKWQDKIYGSSSNTFDPLNATLLDSIGYEGSIAAGDSIAKQKTVFLPNGISGNYYLYVKTDAADEVFENLLDQNNVNRSPAIAVTLSPWADLQGVSISVPDTVNAGETAQVLFSIANKGLGSTFVSNWKDNIYLSPDSVWNSKAVLIAEIERTTALVPDSVYQVTTMATIPARSTKGIYYFYMIADGNNKVYEHTNENNNRLRSRQIVLLPYPPVDLAVTLALSPGTGASGKPMDVQWTVKNEGQAPTLVKTWKDAIYLSLDNKWDEGDIFVAEFVRNGLLNAGASYSSSQTIVLPNGISGSYYLMAVADYKHTVMDVNINNNYRIAHDTTGGNTGQNPTPVIIGLTPPPDLLVSNFSSPVNAISGQPFVVSWTVSNGGTGPTVKGSWTDKVYLSSDNIPDENDRILGSRVHTGNLSSGGSYSGTINATIPVSHSGNYFIIVKTDNNNVEYEHFAENNNIRINAVTATLPPLSDLVVLNAVIPDTAIAGEPVIIEWNLKNEGLNPASGRLKEAAYFSTDTIWDIHDILAGTFDVTINLAPQAIQHRSITTNLPGLSLGDYYLIVQSDILNNIYEINDTNNTAVSDDRMKVTVLELPMNVLTPASLNNSQNLYYKLEIPVTLEGESVLVSLKGDSLNGANELYLRYGDMPTRVEYDYAHDFPFQGNQEVVVPSLKAGTYYILVYGNTSAGSLQNISLHARILNFEIRAVAANKGGNTGKVTIEVTGSKYEEGMKLYLKKGDDTIISDTVIYSNPTKVFATFDLKEKSLGVYDVMATNTAQDTAVLKNGFEIVAGVPSQLLTNMIAPSGTRPSNIIAITIQFSNAGNTDIVNPVVLFQSAGGAPVGYTIEELVDHKTILDVKLQELRGPENVLRPGATGSILIYSKATSATSYILLLPEF